ncbi:MAG: hypothetical protein J7M25_13485 [Deltaproteobacteria bacterium]|nr:hypothetical protein [Deltaproteobacteria bacterium]
MTYRDDETALETVSQAAGEVAVADDVDSVNAGKGAAALVIAKLYFLLSGWIIYFTLPRILDARQWGDYLLVVGLTSVINNVMVGGTIQSISRFTAQSEATAAQVRWAGMRMHSMLGTSAAVLFVGVGAALSLWWSDLGLVPLFFLMGAMVVFYSFYAVFVGSANGQRAFVKQAGLDMSYATLKILFVLGGAYLLSSWGGRTGVGGALGGLVTAAAVIMAVSVAVVGRPSRAEPKISVRPLIRFTLALFLYVLVLNLLMRSDLFLIKKFGASLAGAGQDAAAYASTLAAKYGTAQVFAFIIYQVLMSVAFVVFPLVSKSTFENDHETTRGYVRQTMRAGLMVSAGVAAVLSSMPEAIISVIYPPQYRIGGISLQFLAWGVAGMSMTVIGCAVLNGAGKTKHAVAATGLTLVLAIVGNIIVLSRARTEEQILVRAALTTTTAMLIGFGATGGLLWHHFRAFIRPVTIVRVVIAAAATWTLGHELPEFGRVATVGLSGGLLVVYGVILIVLRELGPDDRKLLTGLLKRRSS